MTNGDREIGPSDETVLVAPGGVASSATTTGVGVALRVKQRANERFRKVLPNEDDQPAPFLCECDDVNCARIVWLTPAAYDEAGVDGLRVRPEGAVA